MTTQSPLKKFARRVGIVLVIIVLLALVGAIMYSCRDKNEIGGITNDFAGNEIKLSALSDPKVSGVTCHLTHFDRGFWDRLSKGNWFENPSNASIACRQTGPIRIGDIDQDRNGETVFRSDKVWCSKL